MRALAVALHRDNFEASHWLRSIAARIPRMWTRHGVLCCPHVVANPQRKAWVALTRPTGLACDRCTDRLPLDDTCARCQARPDDLTGLAVAWNIHGRRVQIVLGLCPTCLTKELPA